MVNFKQYKTLHEAIQLHLINTEAILLMSRKTSRLNIKLYSLYDFYVEVFCDRGEEDPLYIKAFIEAVNIDPYLDTIIINRAENTHNV